jgi:choline dehydrogenase-like flavoprotein
VIRDFGDPAQPSRYDYDVCVVGSGPVGLALALEFLGTGTRLIVLESGGDGHEAEAEALSTFENVGHQRHPRPPRRRMLGGTSSIWSGRCVPFSPLDMQRREWIPFSGWPISGEHLDSYLQRAGCVLQTGPAVYDDRVWNLLNQAAPSEPWDASRFETQVFQASIPKHPRTRNIEPPEGLGVLKHTGVPDAEDLGEQSRRRLADSKNVDVLLHAHAIEIVTDERGARATGVRVSSPSGRSGLVNAQHVILACGGVDNARLLLLSNRRQAHGLGNRFDQVGRYFQDHHYAVIASLEGTQAPKLRRRLGHHWFDYNGTRHIYVLGASLSPQLQRDECLPRATLYRFEHSSRPAGLASARQVARRLLGRGGPVTSEHLKSLTLHPLELAQGLLDRYAFHRPGLAPVRRIDIGCNVEQIPNPSSRITLSDRLDALGQPLAKIDWRLDDREYEAYRRAAQLFVAECARLRLEIPRLSPWVESPQDAWRESLHDMAHPMCATRMSSDPRTGVVDRNCAVHGVEGLHVAGSSVFPTGGTSNPTLTAVALAIRLADRIKGLLGGRSTAFIGAAEPRVRVAIVGAGARVRGVYHPALQALSERLEVVGFTSRTVESRRSLAETTGWQPQATLQRLVEQTRPQCLIVAVDSAANAHVLEQAIHYGLPLLAETPLAQDERAGRSLIELARRRKTSVGVAEQYPFLPAEQLKRKLIRLGAIGSISAVVNDFATHDYHGIAQLRSYLGYERRATCALGQRFLFGRSRVRDGRTATAAELDRSEHWLIGHVETTGGTLLAQNSSSRYATLPTRPRGELRILGQCGSLIGEKLIYVDRASGLRTEHGFQHTRSGMSVLHPALGYVEWSKPPWAASLDHEQLAVALHVEALGASGRFGGVPLYDAGQALQDLEMYLGLQYSAALNGLAVALPLNSAYERIRVAVARLARGHNPALQVVLAPAEHARADVASITPPSTDDDLLAATGTFGQIPPPRR